MDARIAINRALAPLNYILKMEYRILGKTGLRVSVFAVGTYQLSGPVSLNGKADGFPDVGFDTVVNLIHACEDMGLNVIDSAEIYGAGEGERRVGEAIRGRRDRWIVSTKFGWRRGQDGQRITDSHSSTIRTSLEGSLKRLNTDYVDLYLYHTPPAKADIEAGIHALEALKQEGKLRFYGISTDEPDVLAQFIPKYTIDVVQFEQSLLHHPQKILNLVQKGESGSMIRGAFKSGMLSGKYFHTRPALSEEDVRKGWFSTANLNQFAIYEQWTPSGFSMTDLALRHLLDLSTTHTIVLGGKSLDHYQSAIHALELSPLSAKLQTKLTQIRQRFYVKQTVEKVRNKIKFLS